MSSKVEFLEGALKEAQKATRSLDMMAAILIVTETLLLVIAIAGLVNNPFFQLVRNLMADGAIELTAALLVVFVLFTMALIVHILMTIRVVLPVDRVERFLHLGDFEPKGLFSPDRLDARRIHLPSHGDYAATLDGLSDEEVTGEYIYELLKLSYIRRVKTDRLANSFLLLGGLVVGITLFGFLLAIAGILY